MTKSCNPTPMNILPRTVLAFLAAFLLITNISAKEISVPNNDPSGCHYASFGSTNLSMLIDCIDFEDLTPGSSFGSLAGNMPGDTVAIEDGVIITLDSFINFGGLEFGDGDVSNDAIPPFMGNYLFYNFLNLKYDFSQLSGIVNKLRFNVFQGATPVNFSVNGSPLTLYNTLADIPTDIAPGITYSYDDVEQKVELIGNIDHFTLGGVELGIDAICFDLTTCAIVDYSIEQLDCEPGSTEYFYLLDLEVSNETDSFVVKNGDGDILGTYSYLDLPVEVGPFDGDGNTIYSIEVFDQEIPSCGIIIDGLGPVDCLCNLEGLDVYNIECNIDGTYNFAVNFSGQSTSSTEFNLFVNDQPAGTFNYNDLPVAIGDLDLPGNEVSVKVCDTESTACCVEGTFDLPMCECEIMDFEANIFDCADGLFYVELTYNASNVSENGFILEVNNAQYGFYQYTGSLFVGPFKSNTLTNYDFLMVDVINDNCFAETSIEIDQLQLPCDESCEISEAIVNPLTCDDVNQFNVLLDLVTQNVGDSFVIEFISPDIDKQIISYSDLPVELGPYKDNVVVSICDQDNPDCCILTEFDFSDCACDIYDIDVDINACNPNGIFSIDLNFGFANVSDSFSIIDQNSVEYGPFAYDDLPLVNFGSFEGDGMSNFKLEIFDQASFDICSEIFDFGPIDCSVGCVLDGVTVSNITCVNQGEYAFDLNIQPNNNISDSFLVESQDTTFGPFSYDDLPVNIGPVHSGDGLIKVFDQDQNSCVFETYIDFATCDCSIEDLVPDPLGCEPDGTFNFFLDFVVSSPFSDSFGVSVNNNLIGVFNYNDLPVEAGPLLGNAAIYNVRAFDLLNTECEAVAGLLAPQCIPDTCKLFDAEVVDFSCDIDGTYGVFINVQSEAPSDSFIVFSNSASFPLGIFAYTDLPVFVEPLEGAVTLEICDKDKVNCCTTLDVNDNQCPCILEELQIEVLDCDSTNSTFSVIVDFDFAFTSDSFTLSGNGVTYGTYAYADLPIDIGPLAGDAVTEYEFVVTDKISPNCSTFKEIGTVDCLPECGFEALEVTNIFCNSDGTFDFKVNFDPQNTQGFGFDLYLDGELFNFFEYSNLPITIEHYEVQDNFLSVFVCDNDNPDCCSNEEFFQFPDCEPCDIRDLVLEAHPCDGDGFLVDIDFINENTSDSFQVFVNDILVGTFSYDDLFVTVGPFPGDGMTTYNFKIKDLASPDCYAEAHLDPIACSVCEITDFLIDDFECESVGDSYQGFVVFEYENTSDSFNLFQDGDIIGTFAYADLPIFIDGIEGNPGNVSEFKVCDKDHPDCCSNIWEVTLQDCTPCDIRDLIVEALPCDGDSFLVDLDFINENTSDSFQVYVNDILNGTFSYDDLFITIGPFPGDGTTSFHFIVKDLEEPDCFTEADLDPIDCNSCEITDFLLDEFECESTGDNYQGFIEFEFQNTSDSFNLYQGGDIIGTFAYADLPIFIDGIEGNPGSISEFKVCDKDYPDCCSNIWEVELPDCMPMGDCEISNFVVEPFCEDGIPYLELSFDGQFTSDSFEIRSCFTIGTFAYGQSSYIIEITPELEDCALFGSFIPIGVYDQEDINGCFALNFFVLPDCAVPECMISNLTLTPLDCQDSEFNVLLDFDFQNTSDSFAVLGNGQIFGVFSYDDLPVEIGPLLGDGVTVYEFGVIDLGDFGCAASAEVGPVDCDPCDISNLQTSFFCEGDTTYIEFSFDFDNTSDSFIVSSCELLGTFAYGASSYTVAIPPDFLGCAGGGTTIPFGINDQGAGITCFLLEFLELPDCPNECSIYDIETTILDCVPDQEFYLEVDFQTNNVGNLGFLAFVNGNLFGSFAYNSLPITIGPFNPDGTTFYDVTILDLEDPFCFGFKEVGTVECETCELDDLTATYECNDNGTYDATINFVASGVQDPNFDLFVNDSLIGFFAFDSLPITLDSLFFDTATVQWKVCENDNPDCCISISSDVPQCLVSCVDVEALGDTNDDITSADYQPGDFLFEAENVRFYLAHPLFFNWNDGGYVKFNQNGSLGMKGALEMNFKQIENKEKEISLSVGDGPFWISANSSQVNTYFQYTDTTIEISDYVFLTIQDGHEITLSGPINTVSIGSPEISLSSICYEVSEDNIWPGDANYDFIVNHFDVLKIGLAYGAQGPKRSINSTKWEPLPGEDWEGSFIDGINFKNADCDGNGQIDENDVNIIDQNYNLKHGPVEPFTGSLGDEQDPPLYIDVKQFKDLSGGSSFQIPIFLGDSDSPVQDIYGLAFTINYDTNSIQAANITFADNFFGDQNDDYIYYSNDQSGQLDVVITRIDQQSISGNGMIAYYIGIIDDLAGFQIPEVEITNILAVDEAEHLVEIHVPTDMANFPPEVKKDIPAEKSIVVFPNPSEGIIQLSSENGQPIEHVSIYNARGERVFDADMNHTAPTINGSNWHGGLYFIEVKQGNTLIRKKVKIIRP